MGSLTYPYTIVGAQFPISGLSSVQEITIQQGANGALIQAQDEDVLYTVDGTPPDPNASPKVGFTLVAEHDPIFVSVPVGTIIKFKEVAASATVQTLQVLG